MRDKSKIVDDDDRLIELLLQWEEIHETGDVISAEVLCSEFPHLTAKLQERIRKLNAIRPMLATQDFANHDTQELADSPFPKYEPELFATSSQYRVLTHLATGGHGQIHIAQDASLQREVAIKSLRPEYGIDSESNRRLLCEAAVTGRLNHPGIVPVHSTGTDDNGKNFYSMQLISGQTLRQSLCEFHSREYLNKGHRRLEFVRLIRHFIAVCDTIDYAHSQDVIHRDIKPDNILIGEFGETFVVDWGLASVAPVDQTPAGGDDLSTRNGQIMGTQGYMSPEQLQGKTAGRASDIFSLGATLYSLLTGQKPYQTKPYDRNIESVFDSIPAPRKLAATVAPALSSICMKALATKPECRYEGVREMANDIQCWLVDEPVSAHHESAKERIVRWIRRNKNIVAVLSGILLVAAIAFAISTLLVYREKNKTEVAAAVAQENYHLAKSAVDEFVLEVSQNQTMDQPSLRPLRVKLLNKSLAYYQKFLEQTGIEDELQTEMADANEQIALIIQKIGPRDQAIKHLEAALAIRKRILVEVENVEAELKLARTLSRHAELLLNMGKLKETQKQISSALVLVNDVRRTNPDGEDALRLKVDLLIQLGALHFANGEYEWSIGKNQEALRLSQGLKKNNRNGLDYAATILGNMANSHRLAGNLDKALESHEQAVEAFDKLILEDPIATNDWRARKANALSQMGAMESERGNEHWAKSLLQQSIVELEGISKSEPDMIEYQRLLADAKTELGRLLIPSDSKRAKRLLSSAEKIRKKLSESNPNDIGLRFNVAAANCSLAKLDMANEQYSSAISSYQMAIDIFRDLGRKLPDDPQIRIRGLACTLQALGLAEYENADFEDAIESQREALQICLDYHQTAGTLETEICITELSLELASSLRAVGQADEARQILRVREEELADSPFVDAPSSPEREKLIEVIKVIKNRLQTVKQ